MKTSTSVKRDLAIVAGGTFVAAVASVHFELGEAVQSWARRWERYQLDEFPWIALFALAAVVWFVWRRVLEARAELGRRIAAERALESALEENRRLSQAGVRLQEAERRRLARELHDELGQHLNAIKIEAVSIRRGAAEDPEARRGAAAIIDSADHLHAVVRDMTRDLRPAGLDELGLPAALENYVQSWRGRFPEVDVALAIDGDLEHLGEAVNITLYRFMQEALTNVSRHANARHVRIGLARADRGAGEVRIELSDDGAGSPKPWSGDGVGLIGMRERVEALGGAMRIVTSPDTGFAVSASLPVEAVAA